MSLVALTPNWQRSLRIVFPAAALFCPLAAQAFPQGGTVADADITMLAVLGTVFLVLLGSMLSPLICWALRQPPMWRMTVIAVRAGIRWVFWQAIRRVLFLLALVLALSATLSDEAVAQAPTHGVRQHQAASGG